MRQYFREKKIEFIITKYMRFDLFVMDLNEIVFQLEDIIRILHAKDYVP